MACRNLESFASIRVKGIKFRKDHLDDIRLEGNYCYGISCNVNYEELIEKYLALSSTCFVIKEAHFKLKEHKRFSKIGKLGISSHLVLNEGSILFESEEYNKFCEDTGVSVVLCT